MKLSKRILTVAVCLALLLSLSSPAFATTSETLFTRNAAGYRCTGSGIVADWSATAVFDAVALFRVVPPEYATCETWVLAYDSEGSLIGASTTANGTLHSTATYISETKIDQAYFSFEFCNLDLGGYILYNS